MTARPVTPVIAGFGLVAFAVTIAGAQTKTSVPPLTKSTPASASNQPTKDAAPAAAGAVRHGSPVTALAFSSDGKKLAIGSYGQVTLLDTTTWQACGQFTQVAETVRTLAFQPGGS